MQVTKLQVDNLTVDSFSTEDAQTLGQPADEPNFMIANCTGCVSGCGIISPY